MKCKDCGTDLWINSSSEEAGGSEVYCSGCMKPKEATMVNILYFIGHEYRSEDDPLFIGIYTTRTDALEVGRKMCMHEDDGYYIRQHRMNCLDPGETIWSRDADTKPKYRQFYKRFWETSGGFPVVYPDVEAST